MQLDDKDKQIINALFNDGRESLNLLKEKVFKSNQETMSFSGIRKRIKKLEESNLIKIQGNLNINALQYHSAFILIELKNYEEIIKMTEAYSKCPRVFLSTHVTGHYNLILGLLGNNSEDLRSFINKCGPANKMGVLHSTIIFVSKIDAPKYFPINPFVKESHDIKDANICFKCKEFLDRNCKGF